MTALAIASGITVFILLILFIKVKVYFEYDGELSLSVGALFLKFRILPSDEELLSSDELSLAEKRRLLKKLQKKKRKNEKKEEKKLLKRKKAKGKKKKEKKKAEEEAKPKPKKKRSVKAIIRLAARVAKFLLKRFKGHLYIDLKELDIAVATEDAATTALAFGGVSQATAYLLAVLDSASRFKFDNSRVNVRADFLSDKTKASVKLVFGIRIGSAIVTAVGAAFTFLKSFVFKSGDKKQKDIQNAPSQERKTQASKNSETEKEKKTENKKTESR